MNHQSSKMSCTEIPQFKDFFYMKTWFPKCKFTYLGYLKRQNKRFMIKIPIQEIMICRNWNIITFSSLIAWKTSLTLVVSWLSPEPSRSSYVWLWHTKPLCDDIRVLCEIPLRGFYALWLPFSDPYYPTGMVLTFIQLLYGCRQFILPEVWSNL